MQLNEGMFSARTPILRSMALYAMPNAHAMLYTLNRATTTKKSVKNLPPRLIRSAGWLQNAAAPHKAICGLKDRQNAA